MKREGEAYLATPVAAREGAHRRTLLMTISALILLSTSPVFGHHLVSGAGTLLRGRDHLGELCLVALHHLLAPVHEFFHVLLIAGLAFAVWDRLRAWHRTRCVLSPLAVQPARDGDTFWEAAREAGLEPGLLRVVDGLPNPAFTTGWLRPRVFVASSLAQRLSRAELVAVLAHEDAHVMRRDPLRLSMFRFFGRTLFWIPALMRLADDAADEAEVQADDTAAARGPLALASALLALAQWNVGDARGIARGAAVGFSHHDLLERRVRRLAGEDTPVRTHVTRRSLIGAAVALALVWSSGVLMAHPLPTGSGHGVATHGHAATSRDCTKHTGPPILHVFCPGLALGDERHPCPHHNLTTARAAFAG